MPADAFWWRTARVLLPPMGTAMGVTVGGALAGGLAQWLAGEPAPDYAQLAWRLRIWAVAVAIGGTLTALENLEREFLTRGLWGAARDAATVAVAYGGAQVGYWLLRWLARG
jgi:hypothetical protein